MHVCDGCVPPGHSKLNGCGLCTVAPYTRDVRSPAFSANTLYRLQSVPGSGKIVSLVLLYAIHDMRRFPRVQDFASYCRLVKCAKDSVGKWSGTAGTKMGNA